MNKLTVKDLMIRTGDLASIHSQASVAEAVVALGKLVENFRIGGHSSRVLLVVDDSGRMLGKLSPVDMLQGLDASSSLQVDATASAQLGRVRHIIETCNVSQRHAASSWDEAYDVSHHTRVCDIMRKPAKGQIISEDASLNEAMHRFSDGRYSNLFVADGEHNLVGVLDVNLFYDALANMVSKVAA